MECLSTKENLDPLELRTFINPLSVHKKKRLLLYFCVKNGQTSQDTPYSLTLFRCARVKKKKSLPKALKKKTPRDLFLPPVLMTQGYKMIVTSKIPLRYFKGTVP